MLKSKFKFFFMALLCVLSMSCSMFIDNNETGAVSAAVDESYNANKY